MPVPLALAAPMAVAGWAYVNAKTQLSQDVRSLRSGLAAQSRGVSKEKKGVLNAFYMLEDYAQGKLANKPFLIFEGRTWTYKEGYETVLRYGQWLKNVHNVKPKEIVALDFMNGPNFLFIWFGLWSIGAKPAFLNYNLSDKALAHCIRVSKTKLVLVDPDVQQNVTEDVKEALPGVTCVVFSSDLEAEALSTAGVREPDECRREDKLRGIAVLIYTSGTTGLPKPAVVSWMKMGVAPEHIGRLMGYQPKDILYTCMPLYHSSAAVLGVGTTLAAGGTIAIGKKFSTKTFWQEVRASNSTIIQYVGETCRYLLSAPPNIDPVTGENLDKKNEVRLAFGNGLRPEVWNRFKERFGIEGIAEFYAATEAPGGFFNLSKNDFGKGAIGRQGLLASLVMGGDTAIIEVDWETEQPWRDPKTGLCKAVTPGSPGEALFKLEPNDILNKFQGYFGNKSSTESKIVRDVLKKGDAWFRTGDMLSLDSDGRMFFSDRIGDTFRWKSENVSTNEVSECIGEHPGVDEANVFGVELPHHDGRAGCAALVLSEPPSQQLLLSLAQHVRQKLPRFAVPLFLRLTKEMQRTGTNKQQKHVMRAEGVNPKNVGSDDIYWLRNGTYVKFTDKEWAEVNGGSVKL
ncbi:hypothetical protein BP5796_08308 [Coleophoma crateriformis]|uniref:Very long-chain fatty acid transport protein n=1 Tax=Coleophoma crateriformis TaxID=565419 RepID=A0A3D8R7I3_9HELO|nr:hypothetical protein BP5796_08308 [Coleophoma crateriformis]